MNGRALREKQVRMLVIQLRDVILDVSQVLNWVEMTACSVSRIPRLELGISVAKREPIADIVRIEVAGLGILVKRGKVGEGGVFGILRD